VSIDQLEFRQALGYFATGVTVITTRHQDQLHGTTVNSFCSLSLNPPLVLVNIDRRSTIHDLIIAGGIFGVNILDEYSETLSRHFASRIPDKFANIDYWLGTLGIPLLQEALAHLECRLSEHYPGGDHTIFIGEVISLNTQPHSQPLVFYRSTYGRLLHTTLALP
jgi:flavin reductase (DIM6/NTAB) family NADH-FMN oxidoreductase RutF